MAKKAKGRSFVEEMKERILNPPPQPTIHDWVDKHIAFFANVLRPHVTSEGSGNLMNLGQGWKGYTLSPTAPETCKLAVRGMIDAFMLQRQLGPNDGLDGDFKTAVQCAYNLGRWVEAIHLGDIEPLIKLGKLHRAAAAKGGKATTRFTENVRGIAQPIFQGFKRANLSNEHAAQRTAAKLKSEHGIEISAKTIKRHLAP